jgi:hypothetical protein
VDGKLYHPDGIWDPETIYVTVYSKRKFRLLINKKMVVEFLAVSSDVKRKGVGEQQDEIQRFDYGQEANNIIDEDETDPNRRCVDLIVLGISYRSLEADVKKCFEAFGELIFCEVIELKTKKKNNYFYRSNEMRMDNPVVSVLFDLKIMNLNWLL